jgi:glycerophosphoryl diester phosphodiesterase
MRSNAVFSILLTLIILWLSIFTSASAATNTNDAITIIAHRGASGFLPEHTKEGVVLSFMQGAHFIEQDLVATKDKQLVVLHDIYLENVTDVETVFPERSREDGRYYAIDFTLEELRSLRVHERENAEKQLVFPERYQGNARFSIATLSEHIELIQQLNQAFGKQVGWYPELKSPQWHADQGIDITALLVEQLEHHGLNHEGANLYVQSFDPAALKRLRFEFKSKVKLIQLIAQNEWSTANVDYDKMRTPEGLSLVSSYANGIGPWLPHVVDLSTSEVTQLIRDAKAAGLKVHGYTFRSDVIEQTTAPHEAFEIIKQSGMHGLFTDQVLPFMFDQASH